MPQRLSNRVPRACLASALALACLGSLALQPRGLPVAAPSGVSAAPPPALGSAASETPAVSARADGPVGAVDPRVAAAVDEGAARVRALVYLRPAPHRTAVADQRDPAGARDPAPAGSGADRGALPAMAATFAAEAADVMQVVLQAARSGRAEPPRALWLSGALAVEADAAVLRALAARPEVLYVGPDPEVEPAPWRPGPVAAAPRAASEPSGAAWGVRMVGAPQVWQLGIDGHGITVAVLDSGVDYHHPALRHAYRGHVGDERPSNAGNWWCKAVDPLCGPSPLYPVDGVGHGTHVAGTILGGAGVGVAPGAHWIAARVCQQADFCSGSWVIEALQWLFDREPADLPRIVNISLSLEDNLALERAIGALVDAGVVVVASSGNDGNRLRAPAVYPGVIVAGAVGADRRLWRASGYGRSLDGAVKPDVVAPGVAITSSVPGGSFAASTGTSMAAPHVAGAAALLLQGQPDLRPEQVAEVLRTTARPLDGAAVVPDPTGGWGLVNAYGALLTVTSVGHVSGRVTDARDGAPIPWARIRVATSVGDPVAGRNADPNGRFAFDLRPGEYLVIAEAFAYADRAPGPVVVVEGGSVHLDIALEPRDDVGVFAGTLADAVSGARLEGRIRLAGVPPQFDILVDRHVGFGRRLPPGWYEVTVEQFGYRVLTDSIKVVSGATIVRDYQLQPSPRILLVDGDDWAYSGAGDMYAASLQRLGYTFHRWRVTNEAVGPDREGGPPSAAQLADYELVVWTSSVTGPSFVRGARPLAEFLAAGGRLLLSGQDALCTDAGTDVASDPCNSKARPDPYVRDQLNVRVLADNARANQVAGTDDGPFAGMAIALNGPDSMDNQSMPDVIAVHDPLRGRLVARYPDGRGAAALVDTCVPHRALVLGFGFEGVRGAPARDALLARALGALTIAPAEHAVFLGPDARDLLVPSGSVAAITVTVTNTGASADAFDVAIAGSNWPAELWAPGLGQRLEGPLTLAACQSAGFVVRLGVPENVPRGAAGSVAIRVRGRTGAAEDTARITVRTPAGVLVVDGDYVRQSEQRYLEALAATGTPFDTWTVHREGAVAHLPSADDLAAYPAVIWFTGDDWRPTGSLNLQGQRALARYLTAGGRLLFSSEDYLSTRGGTPYEGEELFHQRFLGVAGYVANEGAAHAGELRGAPGSPLSDLAGCVLRAKPRGEDYSDRLVPGGTGGGAALLNLFGQPVATFAAQRPFRSLFLAFDVGLLDGRCGVDLMAAALDWFSPLADSRLELEPAARVAYASGDRVNLRLDLRNSGPRPLDGVRVTWAMPRGGVLDERTLPAAWSWDATAGVLSWTGDLSRNQVLTPAPEIALTLEADLSEALDMASEAVLAADGITITRRAAWRVNAPDLSQSTKSVPDHERVRDAGQTAGFVLNVRNTGTRPAAAFVLTDTLPSGLELLTDSVLVDHGPPPDVTSHPGTIIWRGEVAPGRVTSLSYRARVRTHAGGLLRNRAVLDDGAGNRHQLVGSVLARPQLFLPWAGARAGHDP